MSSGAQTDASAGCGPHVAADGTAVEETTPETAATAATATTAAAAAAATATTEAAAAAATAAAAGQRADEDDDDDDDDEDDDDDGGGGRSNASDVVNSGLPVLTVYMPSDDSESASTSSSSASASGPMPAVKTRRGTAFVAATVGKGILVLKNKKSSNTNRVSFVTTNSSSSSTPSPKRPAKKKRRQQHHSNHQQQQQQHDNDDDDRHHRDHQTPYYARTGRRLTGFGVKSYLHDFYDDPEDNSSFQDDDFKYRVEPDIRWRRHCCTVYTVLGLAVTMMGAAVMTAGHLIPAKDPVVDRSAGMEVIDRWAVAFNEHLAVCRYVGSMVFAVGVVFSVVQFWISVIRDGGDGTAEKKPELAADGDCKPWHRSQSVRIPITGTVENVQPDPRAINLQFGGGGCS